MAENGSRFRVEAKEFIGWAIIKEGSYEPLTLGLASSLMKHGGNFVDVGANTGLFTVFLGVLPDVMCVSIEPHPLNFIKLMENIRINPGTRIRASHLALSSKPEILELEEIDPTNSGTIRVQSNSDRSASTSFSVAAVPIEELLEREGVRDVHLLKVDVEGFEFNVLEGLDWDGPRRPRNVLIEFSDYTDRFGRGGRRELVEFFQQRGYVALTVLGQPLSSSDRPDEDNAWFADRIHNDGSRVTTKY